LKPKRKERETIPPRKKEKGTLFLGIFLPAARDGQRGNRAEETGEPTELEKTLETISKGRNGISYYFKKSGTQTQGSIIKRKGTSNLAKLAKTGKRG